MTEREFIKLSVKVAIEPEVLEVNGRKYYVVGSFGSLNGDIEDFDNSCVLPLPFDETTVYSILVLGDDGKLEPFVRFSACHHYSTTEFFVDPDSSLREIFFLGARPGRYIDPDFQGSTDVVSFGKKGFLAVADEKALAIAFRARQIHGDPVPEGNDED